MLQRAWKVPFPDEKLFCPWHSEINAVPIQGWLVLRMLAPFWVKRLAAVGLTFAR